MVLSFLFSLISVFIWGGGGGGEGGVGGVLSVGGVTLGEVITS